VSSNPDVSTEDLAGTGGGRERQYGETAGGTPDGGTTTPRAWLDENSRTADPGRGDAAVGEPSGASAVGPGQRDVATGGPMGTADTGQPAAGAGDIALLDAAEEQGFRQRWSDTQARFVDDPQAAVQTADALVAELMQSLAGGFSEHKRRLEAHWQSGGTPDTEDLRQALQRYRSFFDRLLST
jgi:hypothetical protein